MLTTRPPKPLFHGSSHLEILDEGSKVFAGTVLPIRLELNMKCVYIINYAPSEDDSTSDSTAMHDRTV
jgi:hypothetical protein